MSIMHKAMWTMVGILVAGIITIGINVSMFAGTSIKENRVESTAADKAIMLEMIQRDIQIQEAMHKQQMLQQKNNGEVNNRIDVHEARGHDVIR